ncbi:hypothetical protein AAK882_05590 [Carnobacteriaceae bacterium 52-44]
MSQIFDELKKKIDNIDKDQVKNIIQQIKQEHDKGNIDKDEKQSLLDKAKDKVGGNIDLGNFGL